MMTISAVWSTVLDPHQYMIKQAFGQTSTNADSEFFALCDVCLLCGEYAMWHWALDLCRTGRARKAAGVLISPMVEQSRRRLGEIPAVAWSDPYIVGFTAMLITMIARIETGMSDGRSLCRVQTKSWQDITERSDSIGEELVLLSAARNRDFEAGCHDAMTLGELLFQSLTTGRSGGVPESVPDYLLNDPTRLDSLNTMLSEHSDLSANWERFFDSRVSLYTRAAI